MKSIRSLIIICIIILPSVSCLVNDEGFHSLIDITINNQSSFKVSFSTKRIGDQEEQAYKWHGIIASQTSESFTRASGYTYEMYCETVEGDNISWGPISVYIDFDQDYEWTIQDPEPAPTGEITINNNTNNEVAIVISGIPQENILAYSNTTYTREIGNHILYANPEGNIAGCWYNYIELTEEGYTWDLETNTEFYPSEYCRVWNFEENYEDHVGINDWNSNIDTILSTIHSKFEDYSLAATNGNQGRLFINDSWIPGESQSFGCWIYVSDLENDYSINGSTIVKFCNGAIYHNNISIFFKKDYIRFTIDFSGNGYLEDIPFNISNGQWHFIGFSYNNNNNNFYGIVDDTIITIENLSGTWHPTHSSNYILIAVYNNYTYISEPITDYLDEVIISINQFIDPQIFVDHYNHKVPWGTEYIP